MRRRAKAKKRITWEADAYHEAVQAVLVALDDLAKAQRRLADAIVRLV